MADTKEARQLFADFQHERARGKKLRTSVLGSMLLCFGLFFGSIYIQGKNFNADDFVAALEREASSKVLPAYQNTLEGVAKDAMPAISDALSSEASKLLPKVSDKLSSEAQIFQGRMGAHMKASLDDAIVRAAALQQDKLKAKFPEFSTDEEAYLQLLERLQGAAQIWAQEELDTTFGAHVHLLQSINETVTDLQGQAARAQADGTDRGVEDVLTIMAEIMNARVAEGN